MQAFSDTSPVRIPRFRKRFGLIVTFIGLLIFCIGTKPEWFNLDRSPVIGFIQIAVFLIGLGLICLGGYIWLSAVWGDDTRSIPADIGQRLIGTGFVISIFTGMADVFGMGSHLYPIPPYFGPLQALGVELGQVVIIVGFLLFIPYRQKSE